MTVQLLKVMGDDLDVVNGARVSLGVQSGYRDLCQHCHKDWPGCEHDYGAYTVLHDKDAGLIKYLMENRHASPFEHVVFKFYVKCTIGEAREWHRHRWASYNERSTRYSRMEPDFYLPEGTAIRGQVGKPGHYTYEPLPKDIAEGGLAIMRRSMASSYADYENLMAMGWAKELARNVLPIGLHTEFIATMNLRSVFNFLSLRMHNTALLEIRLQAKEVAKHVQSNCPIAFTQWIVQNKPDMTDWNDSDPPIPEELQ